MITFIIGWMLPWMIFFIYLLTYANLPEVVQFKGQKKIWSALMVSYPFFVIGVCLLADTIFHHMFVPYYVITVTLILLLMIGIHLYFFKEIIWQEYINMSLRMLIQITLMMHLFFTFILICQKIIQWML